MKRRPAIRNYTIVLVAAMGSSLGATLADEQTPHAQRETAPCAAASENIDAEIEACTKVLETEARESGRRQAAILRLRALAFRQKGDTEHAFEDFSQAIALARDFAPAYAGRADILRDNNQCDEAIADYDQAIKLAPERAALHLNRAACFMRKNENDRAAVDLDRAIELDASSSERVSALALSLKGQMQAMAGNVDGAIAGYDEAIRLDPQRATFYIDRGTFWAEKGDRDRALADYDEAIKRDPDNRTDAAALAWLAKGRLHAKTGSADRAIADYNEAIKLHPKNAALHVERGTLWLGNSDTEHALADYDKAIELEPGSVLPYNARGDFYRGQGDYARALKDYEQAITEQPDYLPAYANRGIIRFYRGDFAKAEEDFKRVIDAQANPYSTLLLYLSRARAGGRGARDARDELAKAAGKLDAKAWPYPIVELFLGRKSLQAAEAAASKPEERCEAQFYIGEWQLLQRANAQAAKALQTAVDTCPKDFVEYRGAVEELKRVQTLEQASEHDAPAPTRPRRARR